MSEENVEIVRRMYDAAAHRDSGVVLALYDPGVEVDMSRAPCRDAEVTGDEPCVQVDFGGFDKYAKRE